MDDKLCYTLEFRILKSSDYEHARHSLARPVRSCHMTEEEVLEKISEYVRADMLLSHWKETQNVSDTWKVSVIDSSGFENGNMTFLEYRALKEVHYGQPN